MTIKKGRRDHFLPQSYLRGFIDPSRKDEPQPLWHLDCRYPKWKMKSTKEVAYQEGLYDLEGDHPSLEEVESADEAFSEFENEFQSIRSWLIARNFRNWHKKLDFLLRYMQMIRVRSPLYFDQSKEQGKTIRASVIEEVHPDGKTLTVGEAAPLSAPQIKNWTIANMREEIRKGVAWMGDFNWALRYSESVAEPFVATEQPLVIEGPCATIEQAVKHPDSLLVFPICWQACLFGSLARFHKGTDKYDSAALKVLRIKYRNYARVFLLSPAKLNDIIELADSQPPGKAVGAP